MVFHFLDFLIGIFLMNAMPHLMFGKLGIRFFSGFGFGDNANLAYSAVNVAVALILFHVRFGISSVFTNGIVVGAVALLLIYFVTVKFFYNMFREVRT